MKCRDCKWCYTNETMSDLYICVNGNSEMLGHFTGLMCEDECENGEEESEDEEISDHNMKMWEAIFKAERSDKE